MKKSIAIIGTRGIPANYGGFETIAKHLGKELALRNFEVYVSCETKLLKPKSPQDYNGTKLVYFPIIECIRNLSEPFLYDMLSILYFSFKVDVILMLGCYFPVSLFIPRLLGRVILVNVDGLEWKRRKFGPFLRFMLKQYASLTSKLANLVLVDSPIIGVYYKQNFSVTPVYVPNGVEEIQPTESENLALFNLSKNEFYLVIARLEPENNIDLIVDEFIKSKSNKKLVIVGPLLNTDFVHDLIRKKDERILFLGGIYDIMVQRTLRHNCFAYIHGHEVGGANPSLIEAMSCKNILLVLDIIFNREVAEGSAFYFNKSLGDLKMKIELIERSPDILNERSALAYTLYKQKYTVKKMIATFVRLLKHIGSSSTH